MIHRLTVGVCLLSLWGCAGRERACADATRPLPVSGFERRVILKRGAHRDLSDVKCHAGLVGAVDPQGRGVLVFSNVPGPGGRRGLMIRTSLDDGRTWSPPKVAEPGNAAYSDLAVTNDGILCVYETGPGSRCDIALARFTWKWLSAGG